MKTGRNELSERQRKKIYLLHVRPTKTEINRHIIVRMKKLCIICCEGPAKSFVTVFVLLQCYVLSNFFITNLQGIPPLLKHIFVTFLPSRKKQINSLLLVSVGDTDK